MRFLKTSEYAIRVLVYMTRDARVRYSVFHLHRELNMPYKYLGRLMHRLAKAGLVEVSRGKTGGYMIARPTDSVYLSEIVGAVEGLGDFERCVLGLPTCSDENPCPLHGLWESYRNALRDMLSETTLQDLANEPDNKPPAGS